MPDDEGDVFISYARKDDQSLRESLDAGGFVGALCDHVLTVFEGLGPPTPRLFRDVKQIERADQFEPRLGKALDTAKMMVVVLSRNWLASEWCRRELETFVRKWQERGESEAQIKERLALVLKHVIPPERRPVWLQGQDGYPLVKEDRENREEIEFFNPDLGPPSREWFRSVNDLAKDLRKRIYAGEQLASPDPGPNRSNSKASSRLTVFLAKPAADMEKCYDTLVDELTRRGFRIVPDPDTELPMEGDQAGAMIDSALDEARLSIHLLGDRPGFAPDGALPIVRLQLERAAARVSAGAPRPPELLPFHRLIWAPRVVPGSMESGPGRALFDVLAVHSPGPAVPGDKLDGDTLTKFTQFVVQHLENLARPAAPLAVAIAAGSEIYVQHHEQDSSVAESLADSLKRLGFAPVLPVLTGDPAERRQIHLDSLQRADAVVLCWALAGAVWVRASAAELRSLDALGRGTAFKIRTVVALPPQAPDKDRLRKFPPKNDFDTFIDATNLTALGPDQLDPLLRSLLGTALEQRPRT